MRLEEYKGNMYRGRRPAPAYSSLIIRTGRERFHNNVPSRGEASLSLFSSVCFMVWVLRRFPPLYSVTRLVGIFLFLIVSVQVRKIPLLQWFSWNETSFSYILSTHWWPYWSRTFSLRSTACLVLVIPSTTWIPSLFVWINLFQSFPLFILGNHGWRRLLWSGWRSQRSSWWNTSPGNRNAQECPPNSVIYEAN